LARAIGHWAEGFESEVDLPVMATSAFAGAVLPVGVVQIAFGIDVRTGCNAA
jgi:hypothetical protein